jgi:hypothetical protein
MKAKYISLISLVGCVVLAFVIWKPFASRRQNPVPSTASGAAITNTVLETNASSVAAPDKLSKAQPPKSPLSIAVRETLHYSGTISSDGKVTDTNVHRTVTKPR